MHVYGVLLLFHVLLCLMNPKGGEGQMKDCSHKLMIWFKLQGGSTKIIYCYILVLFLNFVVQFLEVSTMQVLIIKVFKAKGFLSPSNRGRLLKMNEAHLYLALVCLM